MNDPQPPSDPLEDLVAECLRRHSLDGVLPLDELCAQHPQHAAALRERVRQLGQLGLAGKPAAAAPQQIGPYRILDVLGEGGMGTVYLAEQKSPVRRRVALKLIKLGMDSKAVVARFEQERQALALMQHDGIAKVFDAGTTDRGQPFFVMEYVKGVPITDYCDRNRLPTRGRLHLLQQVCDAVQHAHHKGVIHRDLKPSNILVTEHEGQPRVKVIDFGLARATDHRLVEATIFTEHGQLLGTPEYMSPEQAEMSSAEIDTRTDVYSLGVLLYELLVGELPFSGKELRQAGLLELRRRIREDEPLRPSTRLTMLGDGPQATARLRHTTKQVLLRELRGDLDWVVMRALEKDRNRRYQTPRELEQEMGRFLADEPVLAGPPSAAYRLRKFTLRHRGRLVAASVVLASLVAALIYSSIQQRIARTQLAAAREATTRSRMARLFYAAVIPRGGRATPPSIAEILESRLEGFALVSAEDVVDGWDHELRVAARNEWGALYVVSAGPDGIWSTSDDLVFENAALAARAESSIRMVVDVSVRTLESAAAMFAQINRRPAATVADLVDAKILESVAMDPWGSDYFLLLQGDRVIARSAGPNRIAGDADDLGAIADSPRGTPR